MEIYLDTAKVEEIREFAWLIDGVTTNPTLLAQAGRPFREALREICSLVRGPVSAEVVSPDEEGMVREAQDLAKIADNIVIRIPLTLEGLRAVNRLKTMGIKTNVTLVFSAPQAILAAKCGADYVSPFVGRIDDHGGDGMSVVAEIIQIFKNYEFPTKVIVASVRHPGHVVAAATLGAPIVTVPYSVLQRLFTHPLTEQGIIRFLADWEKVRP